MEPSPTLLVAGVAGGNATLRPLLRHLRRDGIDAAFASAPPFRTASLARSAAPLRREILAHPAEAPLVLFGYSMGGLIAAVALEDPSVAARVRRLVTFGTPFDGTWAAWPGIILGAGWMGGPPDLRPGAPALSAVRARLHGPARTWTLAAVNGRRDILAPYPQEAVPSAESRGGDYDHLSILHDGGLHALLASLIRAG